jgi:hypothetical protein
MGLICGLLMARSVGMVGIAAMLVMPFVVNMGDSCKPLSLAWKA